MSHPREERGGLSPRALGALAAGLSLAIDQGWKLYFLHVYELGSRQLPIPLAPFFDLTMAWNYGVSYSWFTARSTTGWLALIGFTAAATLFLAVWMWRQETRIGALSLGLIVGGAVGNLIDRIAYGAVADFFHFHVGDFSWYVFNLADVAIVAGVLGLLYESFAGPKPSQEGAGAENSPP